MSTISRLNRNAHKGVSHSGLCQIFGVWRLKNPLPLGAASPQHLKKICRCMIHVRGVCPHTQRAFQAQYIKQMSTQTGLLWCHTAVYCLTVLLPRAQSLSLCSRKTFRMEQRVLLCSHKCIQTTRNHCLSCARPLVPGDHLPPQSLRHGTPIHAHVHCSASACNKRWNA